MLKLLEVMNNESEADVEDVLSNLSTTELDRIRNTDIKGATLLHYSSSRSVVHSLWLQTYYTPSPSSPTIPIHYHILLDENLTGFQEKRFCTLLTQKSNVDVAFCI